MTVVGFRVEGRSSKDNHLLKVTVTAEDALQVEWDASALRAAFENGAEFNLIRGVVGCILETIEEAKSQWLKSQLRHGKN